MSSPFRTRYARAADSSKLFPHPVWDESDSVRSVPPYCPGLAAQSHGLQLRKTYELRQLRSEFSSHLSVVARCTKSPRTHPCISPSAFLSYSLFFNSCTLSQHPLMLGVRTNESNTDARPCTRACNFSLFTPEKQRGRVPASLHSQKSVAPPIALWTFLARICSSLADAALRQSASALFNVRSRFRSQLSECLRRVQHSPPLASVSLVVIKRSASFVCFPLLPPS